MGRTMFEVGLFKAKNRVFEFDYQKTNMLESVQSSSLFDEYFIKSIEGILGSVRSKPKFRCSSLIINSWTRWSLFDVQKMMFKFVQCSIKWCLTHLYHLMFNMGILSTNHLFFRKLLNQYKSNVIFACMGWQHWLPPRSLPTVQKSLLFFCNTNNGAHASPLKIKHQC